MSGANTWNGANTWSIALNENSQLGGGGGSSGVQTITAGTNITLTGTATNPTINSTAGSSGVSSITADSGIAVNQSTGAVVIKNTGVNTITAGTNITLTGSATDRIISASFSGVQSVSAGTNTTITGTATNPIINATAQTSVGNGKVSYTNFAFDGAGDIITIPANQLGNAFIYCNIPNSVAQTLYLPNVNDLTAFFGANAVVNFFIGQLNVSTFNPIYPNSALGVFIVNPTGNEYWANNYINQAPDSPLLVKTWTNYNASISVHFPALYKVQLTIQGGRAFYYYDYAGFSFP
jgi:hypothetical protein